MANVILYYRFSTDNVIWGDWMPYETNDTTPYEWSFIIGMDPGYYQLVAVGTDKLCNTGDVPDAPSALMSCATRSRGPLTSMMTDTRTSLIWPSSDSTTAKPAKTSRGISTETEKSVWETPLIDGPAVDRLKQVLIM